jgi:beta-1,2-mannobiose phosphorylase / 1,2-beta-oligomannan phosphorylase
VISFKRSDENPVLVPRYDVPWEARGAFNGCPVADDGKIHIVYRAQSEPQEINGVQMSVSSIGYAVSKDGIHFTDRRQLVTPSEPWDRFGCEDPRVTKIGDTYYIFYTALSEYPFRAEGIRIGVALTKDFKTIIAKHLVTPFNAKAMVLFPDKVSGQYAALLTVHTDMPPVHIGLALFDRIEDIWSPDFWNAWYTSLPAHIVAIGRGQPDHLEVGAPPIKTKHGWLFFFSYIENYFTPPPRFTIQAALLDLHFPMKILARTMQPLLETEEEYEKYGVVPNIVFPTGAVVQGKKLLLYYGAADTVTAAATAPLSDMLKELLSQEHRVAQLIRYHENPILRPIPEHPWEAKAVFNPAAIYLNGRVHMVYRAMSPDNTSTFGYASSADGLHFDERLDEPVYVPRESFEQKTVEGGNSGCEDPRLTKIGETMYMCYTAFDGRNAPRVALTSISVSDFLAKKWNWSRPKLISKEGQDDKDAALFPRMFGSNYLIFHRLGQSIWLDIVGSLDADWSKRPLEGSIIMDPRTTVHDSRKIGIAGPPIETDDGWLLIYHGVSRREDHHYHLRAALLDKKNPSKVLARTKTEILDTETPYERYGIVPNVVFSCGQVVIDGQLVVYYGAADTVIGVASIPLAELTAKLKSEKG